MEFPHGHHHHHSQGPPPEHRRPDEYGYGQPPPPRPEEYGYGHPPPPRPEEYGYNHPPPPYGHQPPPRPEEYGYGHPPPPRPEEYGYGGPPSHRPEVYGYGGPPPPVAHVSHHVSPHGVPSNDPMTNLMNQPSYKIYCKGNENVSLAIRNGTVLLVNSNKDDLSQHWIKDLKFSTRVKDEEGYPAFSLINKATKLALKHSLGQSHPVQLAEYNPEKLEESVLWTQSRDVGEEYRCIRMVNNIYLNFDAFHGDKQHGGVHDGTTVVLWKWTEGDNQRWKIVPW